MRASTRSLAAFRAQQQDAWDKAALGWREWWPVFEQGAQPLTDRLLDLAGVAEGQRVLDIATGIGEPAVSAALRVGLEGAVVGVDRSAGMLEVARDRAERRGLRNTTFLQLAAEDLNFPANSFDAGLCRWGLMFVDDVAGALEQVRRHLRPGGWLAVAVWAASPKVPLISLPLAVIARTLRLPPQPDDASFTLANRHALAHTFGQAGFTKIHSETFTLTTTFPDAATYTRYLQAVSPNLTSLLSSLPPGQQSCLWQAVEEAARQRYISPDGMLRLPGEAICIAGQKPW
jgi:ubiquinone/menaquinone biosynthesis C-methylase UbiE